MPLIAIILDVCQNGELEDLPADMDANVVKHARSRTGQTALQVACANGKLEIVRFLLRLGVLVKTIDDEGWSPLHSAAMEGFEEVVTELLKVNEAVGFGESEYFAEDGPVDLYAMVYDEDEDVCKGADDLAKDQGHFELAELIRGKLYLLLPE